jgi:phosphotriesterase-related protein
VLSQLTLSASLLLSLYACQSFNSNNPTRFIHTVSGAIAVAEIKVALSHEHIMSNFGKDISEASIYDEAALMQQVVPYLQKVKALGVDTIFDYTTAYFGRRVDLLEKIAAATELNIVTNTGFYGAAEDRYIPAFAYQASAESIASIWINEFKQGIDNTKIKPGFIKLGFDNGEPSAIDQKLFIAGLITHKETGLTVAVHTGDNLKAMEWQLQMLDEYNISPDAWIWAHANRLEDTEQLISVAKKGAWVSLDGVNIDNVPSYIAQLKIFRAHNVLHKVLLSHDGNAYPMGGEIRPALALHQHLIPAMLKNDFTAAEIHQLLVDNPRNAYGINLLPSQK